jgi:hypothetical protein
MIAVPGVSPAQSQLPPPQRSQGQQPQQRGQPLPPPQRSQQPAQPQRGQQPAQQQQPAQEQQAVAPGPYKAVAVAAPEPMKDESLEAFRKQIEAVAQRKDRKALAGMVLSQGFFWIGERGNRADKRKPGIDNLAKAIGLDGKDGDGWELLMGYSTDPTAMDYADRKDTVCSPADPVFKEEEFEELLKVTDTEGEDWAVPIRAGLEMRASAQANAAVVEKLGMHFVRIVPDDSANNSDPPTLRVMAPSGKTGFVPEDVLGPLGNDQICYGKDGGGWKIVGFIGGQ